MPQIAKHRAVNPLASLLAIMLLPLLLGGCPSVPTDALEDTAAGIGDGQSEAAKIADRLFGEATGPDNRAIRLCMIGSGVIELMTDRVTHADTSFAAQALGSIVAVQGVLAALDSSAGNIWFETDVKIVTLQLAELLVESAKDRVPRLLSNFAGAVNPLGLAGRAAVAARQGVLVEGIVLDTKHAIAAINAGTLKPDVARAGCEARISRNERRIRAILGGMP